MASETHPKEVGKEKQRQASAISGGIFLISLGVLFVTGWWWPGIMVAIGLASGAELVFRGKVWSGIGSLLFFCGIAVVVELMRATDISWTVIAAFILIGIGVIILVKAFFLSEE
ncbi:MAG: hypothetical protein GWP61_14360 [Chloroflexi bacterium]|jgi:hypothetical protein|nr:hypothetical protein [Chloroflexota bacterium]